MQQRGRLCREAIASSATSRGLTTLGTTSEPTTLASVRGSFAFTHSSTASKTITLRRLLHVVTRT